MAMKQQGRKQYRSMQGKNIDMDMLRQKNELTPAVGNAKVNARGDELGAGGQIIKKREDVLKAYYEENPAMPDEIAVKKPQADSIIEPDQFNNKTQKNEQDDWIEDENGDFVKRGDND
tara:strand:- start:2948 stop:3301 length:354 start_codon:yes stop_codon:yes gene_type:complete